MDWTFNASGFSYQHSVSIEVIREFMLNYRLGVIEQYIDNEFINNEKYLAKVKKLTSGNIRNDIYSKLNEEFSITEDNEKISELVDRKGIELIKTIYV